MAGEARTIEWQGGRPRLTHMGINVVDIDRMVDFYTRILGLKVSDRGYSERLQCNLAFLTSDPKEHHQVVMLDTRKEGVEGNVNQISFTVPSLDALRDAYNFLREEDIDANPISHGNAWSVYFPDPEQNMIEIYLNSPFYVPQPHGVPLDLSLSNEEIVRTTEERIRDQEGFATREEWAADLAAKLEGAR